MADFLWLVWWSDLVLLSMVFGFAVYVGVWLRLIMAVVL